MKNRCIIIGVGEYSVMLKKYIEMTTDWEIMGFAADKEFIDDEVLDGVNTFSIEELPDKFSVNEIFVIMGIGYSRMSEIRKKLFEQVEKMGFRFRNYIHPTAILSSDAVIGTGNNIFERVLIQSGTIIGNANLIYGSSVIGHNSIMGNYNSISLNVTVAGCVTIGNNCFIGAGATLRDHIKIDDYALIGAGAYASRNVESYKVIANKASIELEGKISTDYF